MQEIGGRIVTKWNYLTLTYYQKIQPNITHKVLDIKSKAHIS